MQVAPAYDRTADWYRVSDMPPPLTVRVRITLPNGHAFVGARGRHPKTGREVWVEMVAGRMQVVDGDFDRSIWQPLFPDKWQGKLPEPVARSKEGIMWSSRTRFQAVEEASSADLAREMEHDREAARVSGKSDDFARFHVERRFQWWWNLAHIRYETAPRITIKGCEGRIMRAVAWSGAWTAAKPVAARDTAMELVAETVETDDPSALYKFQPLQTDHDDFPIAMGWYARLNPVELRPKFAPLDWLSDDQVIVAWRARPFPLSWPDIAKELARRPRAYDGAGNPMPAERRKPLTGSRIEQRFREAIDLCWRFANGLPGGGHGVDQMELLRERNRAFKRSITGGL